MGQMSVEQMCRNLLTAAFEDGVSETRDAEALSSGDLVGMANLLNEYLSARNKRGPFEWTDGEGSCEYPADEQESDAL